MNDVIKKVGRISSYGPLIGSPSQDDPGAKPARLKFSESLANEIDRLDDIVAALDDLLGDIRGMARPGETGAPTGMQQTLRTVLQEGGLRIAERREHIMNLIIEIRADLF